MLYVLEDLRRNSRGIKTKNITLVLLTWTFCLVFECSFSKLSFLADQKGIFDNVLARSRETGQLL
jgi:hypothetical protein